MIPPTCDAREALQKIIFEILRRYGGESAVTTRPANASSAQLEAPVDPLLGVEVATLLTFQLHRMISDYTRESRGMGRSWNEVSRALRLDREWAPEQASFDYVAGNPRPGMPWPSISWTCCSCGFRITDWGPESGSHPDDRETGHAPDCDRHTTEIRKYLNHLNRE
ncbi:hypothetical protein [Nocardia arthritidis]|uniref:Uncharacterized protein n=1 Tax=Nocardia arthritidis TaxID=228602 RepID=A0A6G9Y6K6_9NOCA|nr:hypothetical protein [Nocardia arthritidis]QIS08841.1 hypothetical protein F5544_04635 [Nocardia arthritidis]